MSDIGRKLPGLLPLLLIVFPLLLSWWVHGLPKHGAAPVLVWLIVLMGYSSARVILRQHITLALFIVLGVVALAAIGQVLYVLIMTGKLIRPIDTNVLAPVMVGAIILALKEDRRALAGLYAAGLLISGSMAGLLAAGAAWVIGWGKMPRWGMLLITGGALVSLTVLASTHGIPQERIDIWRMAALRFVDNFWLGGGPGGFRALPIRFRHAHNIWMQVAADLGSSGVIAVIGVVGFYAWRIWRSKDPRWGLMLLAALLVEGLFDFIYWVPQASVLLLLIGDQLIRTDASGEYGHSARFGDRSDNPRAVQVHQPPA